MGDQEEAFSTWLVRQVGTSAWYSALAAAAKADRALPRLADAQTLRVRLHAMGAEPDMFEMLDDAERSWLVEQARPFNACFEARG